MKNRRRKLKLAILFLLLCAAGVAAWNWHYLPKRALAEYRRRLAANGEKLELSEVIPVPVLSEQNSADIFLKAPALLNARPSVLETNPPSAMNMVAAGKAMIGWREPHGWYSYDAQSSNTWVEADQALADISPALEMWRGIIEQPVLDFRLDYHQGYNLPLNHLLKIRQAARRLSAAVLCDLHRSDSASAVTNIRAVIALAKGMGGEPLIISQLVRFSVANIAVNATWELLQSPNVSDEQLARLQHDWQGLEFVQPVEKSLAMERAMGTETIAQMRGSTAGFHKVVSGMSWRGSTPAKWSGNVSDDIGEFMIQAWKKTEMKSKETAWRVAWSYTDQTRQLEGFQALLDAARMVRSNGGFAAALSQQALRMTELGITNRADSELFDMAPEELDFRTLLSQSVVSLPNILSRAMSIEVSHQLTITAIALKRYELRHGSLPAGLSAMIPEFLATVPGDPVDGQPLRYRRDGAGSFLLYSVGKDGLDDGGDPKPADGRSNDFNLQSGRDWVWPQPASPEELAAYYTRLMAKIPKPKVLTAPAGQSLTNVSKSGVKP